MGGPFSSKPSKQPVLAVLREGEGNEQAGTASSLPHQGLIGLFPGVVLETTPSEHPESGPQEYMPDRNQTLPAMLT